jgi:hypothetical protein
VQGAKLCIRKPASFLCVGRPSPHSGEDISALKSFRHLDWIIGPHCTETRYSAASGHTEE